MNARKRTNKSTSRTPIRRITRVTMVGTMPPNKGISDTCLEQVEHLAANVGVEFIDFKQLYPEWLYPGATKEYGVDQPAIPNVTIKSVLTWYNPISWIRAAFSIETSIVHLHWWTYVLFGPLFTIALISTLRGKRVICSIHNVLSHESHIFDRLLTRLFLSMCDNLICHSSQNRNVVIQVHRIKPTKLSVIPLGIPNYLVKEIPQAKAQALLNLPKTEFVLLYFGNIRKYKGVDTLIHAFARLRKAGLAVYLVIAGRPWIDCAPYKKLIESYQLQEVVRLYLDYVPTDEVGVYFSAADLLVLPYTHFDGQSGPGRIALGHRLPMVVTDKGGLVDLVPDKESCIVVERRGEPLSHSLAKVIQNIIADHSLCEQLSLRVREKQKEFSWSTIAEKTIELYEG